MADVALSGLPPRLVLAAREVHLWAIDLGAGHGSNTFDALLSQAELSRAQRFRAASDGRRFVAARGWLRMLLGRYTGLAPASLLLQTHSLGKPWLAQDPRLHFNSSHGGAMLLVGVTRLAPIGVDIEAVRSLPGRSGVVDSCFAQHERSLMAHTAPEQQDAAFFRIWTGKEAVVKALGTGLSTPLDSIDGLPGPWTLRRWCPRPGYQAAVALQAQHARLRFNPARPADPASPASPA